MNGAVLGFLASCSASFAGLSCGGIVIFEGTGGAEGTSASSLTSVAAATVAASSTSGSCSAKLLVGAVKVSSGDCFIDEKVGLQDALLTFPCGGGSAEADFAVPFVGTVANGQVDIAATTVFPWSDGCTWQSNQRIEGTLASGALFYTYDEHPITKGNCAPDYCKGKAKVVVK